VLLSVSDSGPGIRDGDAEIIFDRFRQTDGSITRKHDGSGLGLAIVRDVVALHGGSVRVGPSATGGAAFVVTLPHASGSPAAFDAAPQAPVPIRQLALESTVRELSVPESAAAAPEAGTVPDRPMVLVVEDNAELRAFIADLLGSSYNVGTAADGLQGLERAHALHPDLIVTDIMMPRMSGDQMAKALRASTSMADVPVLLLTARADEEMRVALLSSDAHDYLIKPFHPSELEARGQAGQRQAYRRQTARSARRRIGRPGNARLRTGQQT
jgi:CheY-like chemotaxis protein